MIITIVQKSSIKSVKSYRPIQIPWTQNMKISQCTDLNRPIVILTTNANHKSANQAYISIIDNVI